MKTAEDTFVMPGQTTPEVWRALGKHSATRQESSKAKSAAWIALPMRSMLSVPMHFPAMNAERREAAVALELEGAGVHVTQTDFQTLALDSEQREHRAWSVVLSAQLPEQALKSSLDCHFAPSVSFQTLKGGEARLWDEAQRLTLAIPDEAGRTLHAQALTATEPDEDAAAEIRCILGALELSGMTPVVESLALLQAENSVLPDGALVSLANHLEIPVSAKAQPAPHLPREAWRLVPPVIVSKRHQRSQQQTLMLAGAGFVLVLLALLGAFAGRLWTRERALAAETARLTAVEPELQTIRDAKARWQIMEDAVTPDKSAMEIFHQVSQLLPPEGIRLEIFEMRDGHIILSGEAANQGLAGQFREDLQRVPTFSGLTWDLPNAELQPDGRARFRYEASPPEAEEAAL
ncbi:MAG: hypothetical protein ACOYOF_15005 [Verrucomicrobiaceae bacterium]|jgi:hypothetical protein